MAKKEILTFLTWTLSALVVFAITIFVLIATDSQAPDGQAWALWIQSLPIVFGSLTTYVIAVIPYLSFALFRSIYRDYREKGKKGLLVGFSLKLMIPVLLIVVYFQFVDSYRLGEEFDYSWDYSVENNTSTIRDLYAVDSKQRGMHVFNLLTDSTDLDILKANNFEWITIVPYLSQQEYNTPSLARGFRSSSSDSTPRFNRIRKTKELADTYGFKIMLKPHIWLNNQPAGIWRSNIKMQNEQDWNTWFALYESFILDYARLAEELGIELFCIGTELHTPVTEKPEMWMGLIEKVREVYSGDLTYAANWSNEVEHVAFWDKLDFIGVQAYFPIAKYRNPGLEHLENGWKEHIDYLKIQSDTHKKPILFTEIGYKSTPNAGIKPWEWDSASDLLYRRVSKRTQALAYQAFFNTIWDQPWFAGAHLWQWQSRGSRDGNDNTFTLEGKPALNVVAKGFNKIETQGANN